MLRESAPTIALPPGTRLALHDARAQEIDVHAIAPLLQRIVARWQPLQIWLFGSRARGEATPESDWDLLVVVADDTRDEDLDPLEIYRTRKSSGVRADIVLYPAQEFREDLGVPNTLLYEVARDGVLLYES